MDLSYEDTCRKLISNFGEEVGELVVKWVTKLRDAEPAVRVLVQPHYHNHWLIQIYNSVPLHCEDFMRGIRTLNGTATRRTTRLKRKKTWWKLP